MIARAPGVGPKLAQRIVVELKDKTPSMSGFDMGVASLANAVADRAAPKPVADAISALANLGYPQAQAMTAIAAAVKTLGDGAETSALIRQGLKELAK
jgi:Holliday junction DNA helicase RuvA